MAGAGRPAPLSLSATMRAKSVALVVVFVAGVLAVVYGRSLFSPAGGSPKHGASVGSALAAGASGSDARLVAYLQKRFRIPDPALISLGPPKPSPIQGLSERTVTVKNETGFKASVQLFTDADGTKFILGRLMDLNADPWDRVDMKKVDLTDRPTEGPVNAPITVVEFADFECPYCARAFGDIETLVNETYKGQVRLIFKNFPLNQHPWATQAAIAAECVRQQNPQAFWTFARYLYGNQADIKPETLRQHIEDFATSQKLDTKALDVCMLSPAPERRVTEDMHDGNAVGIRSTPTFLINGIMVAGMPSDKVFDFIVRSEMRHAAKVASAPK